MSHKPDLEANTQHPLRASCSSMTTQEIRSNKDFSSVAVNQQYNYSLTPCTPPYSPLQFHSPVNSQFPSRKYRGEIQAPASMSTFSSEAFEQTPVWSPFPVPCSALSQQSPVWSTFSPGTIGQERHTPILPQTHREHFLPRKRSHGHVARRYIESSSGHHNVVEIDRIRQGTDVRTTASHLSLVPTCVCSPELTDYATQYT